MKKARIDGYENYWIYEDDYTPPNKKKEVFNKSFVTTKNLF